MTEENQNIYNQRQPKHLDQFPQEKTLTPWERAVLERARRRAFRHHKKRGLHEDERGKCDVFWEKFSASEASEISKRRQIRSKKSFSRLERYEQLDKERYERNLRFGILGEDVLSGADRLKRRAERFGLQREPSGRDVIPNDNVEKSPRHRSLADYADNLQRLEKRRARFAMEPREDSEYKSRWMSDMLLMNVDPMDEARRLARKQRFSQPVERDDGRSGRGDAGRGRTGRRSSGRSRSRARPVRRSIGGRDIGMQQTHNEFVDSFAQQWDLEGEEWSGQGSNRQALGDRATAGMQGQRDNKDGEWLEDVETTQEWEARGESWDTVDMDNDTVRNIPPDRVEVTDVRSSSDVMRAGQRWNEIGEKWPCEGEMDDDRRERRSRRRNLAETPNESKRENDGGGRGLQSWEASGETW